MTRQDLKVHVQNPFGSSFSVRLSRSFYVVSFATDWSNGTIMRLRTDALQQCCSRGLISDYNMSKAERRETRFMPTWNLGPLEWRLCSDPQSAEAQWCRLVQSDTVDGRSNSVFERQNFCLKSAFWSTTSELCKWTNSTRDWKYGTDIFR